MSDADVEAGELEAALNWTLAQIAGNVAEFRSSHTDAETVLAIRQDFVNLAYVRAYGDAGSSIIGDYVGFGMALLRLLDARKKIMELTEAVAMRDSVIRSLGELEDL
jgi:hypothetical protein